jgi:hypothetical protein
VAVHGLPALLLFFESGLADQVPPVMEINKLALG